MAHELELDANGQARFVAVDSAWHRLGVILNREFTAEEVMDFAGLGDWNVRKVGIQGVEITTEGVTLLEAGDKFMTIRTNPDTGLSQYLGIVGNYYEPVQNEQMADFLNALVDEGGAHFTTAGSIFDGRRCFISMKMPAHMKIGGVDAIDWYIVATNAHDGTAHLQAMVTPIRPVCYNTLTFGMHAAPNVWKIRHTKTAANSVNEARAALDMSFDYKDTFEAEAEKMIQETLSETEFRVRAKKVIRPMDAGLSDRQRRNDNLILDAMGELFADADTQANIRGTRWAGFQAVTEWNEHHSRVQAKGRERDIARAERAVAGGLQDFNATAFRAFAVS